MAGKKPEIIEFKHVETHHCIIAESILRNILNKWQAKWEHKYKVKTNKVEKISWLLSLLGIDLTLWTTYATASFSDDYIKAVVFVTSIAVTLCVVYVSIAAYKAYRIQEETLDIEDLIKDIEKRTE
ncbi:MAG: hypothetical protein J6B92_06060 [Paraprevotella sp.]|jgi:hypothetical protein|nr:hypothetical protein [Paraprevotella sp.]